VGGEQFRQHQAEITAGFHFAGSGAEAAIGQLTRLTSLHMSVDQECTALLDEADLPTMQRSRSTASIPLQLQLLGCGERTSNANGDITVTRSASCKSAARRNTNLQELTLECAWYPCPMMSWQQQLCPCQT
jgi:hypothetical protein